MKIAIIGANGKVGAKVAKEAQNKNYEVTAIVRDKSKTSLSNVIEKDVLSVTKEDLAGFDVVVSAVGFFSAETFHLFKEGYVHLAKLLSGTDTRLVIVGGAGSLYADADHTKQISDLPDFPDAYKPLAKAMADGLAQLRTFSNVKWTFFSPAADFDADGPRTGEYILGNEEYFENSKNQSYISYADYAIALVDELENKSFIRQRFTAVSK